MSDSLKFFRHVFRGAAGFVTVSVPVAKPSPRPGEKPTYLASYHYPVGDLEAAVDCARQLDEIGGDAYFGLAARRADLGEGSRGAFGDLVGLGCLWLDLDVGAVGHASDSCPPDEDAAAELLREMPAPPSMAVSSGGGVHVYWLLDEWCPDVRRVEAACKAWQALAQRLGAAHGWSVDQTGDAARVLRVPGTRNYKTEPARPVELDCPDEEPRRYPLAELARLCGSDAAAAAPAAADPGPMPAESYDLDAMRAALSDVRRSKAQGSESQKAQAEVLGRVLEGRSLADADGKRHRARLSASGLLAYHLPAGTPWLVAAELMRPSLAATPVLSGEEDPVEKTRLMYERALASRALADERRASEIEAFDRLRKSVADRRSMRSIAADLAGGWESLLLRGQGGPRACEHNVDLILSCAPEVRGTLRWNLFAKTLDVFDGPFAGVPVNSLEGRAAGWLQMQHGCMVGAGMVGGALLRVARENPYDPVAEYLGEVAWDGEPRIDLFLERYFGASGPAPYVRGVSRRWLTSLVARALDPGCKVDSVLILEGPQGVGKSKALKALVGADRFIDTKFDIGSKDALQLLSAAWLIELGELSSLKRAETEAVKQFISSSVDMFRPPYGRVPERFPRRSIFAGTTNNEEYLKDPTGNRRFWPVQTGVIDDVGVARDRDLLLAEAVVAFRSGERWWFTPDEERTLVATETATRAIGSVVGEVVERWWFGLEPARRPRRFTTSDVAEMALKIPPGQIDRGKQTELGFAVRKLGFRRRVVSGSRYYEPTLELLEAPRQTTAARAAGMSLVQAFRDKVPKGDLP